MQDHSIGLTNEEILRYGRHLVLPNVGVDGQKKLKAARVLLIGAGGLGSPVALYLAAVGVGTLGLVDFDVVELTNLQRQVMYGSKDIGLSKIAAARDRIHDINPNVAVEAHEVRFSSFNALEIAKEYDILIDGTDNFPTRYLVNDVSVLLNKPNVYASIYRFEGQASIFAAPGGPCYRCLFRSPPPVGLVPSCAEGGVIGVLPGLLGTIQAAETVKSILGLGHTLAGRLLLIDALEMTFRAMNVRPDPQCPVCGTRELKELVDYEDFCATEQTPQQTNAAEKGNSPEVLQQITPTELAARIARGEDFDLIDVRENSEWDIVRLSGARLIPVRSLASVVPTLDPEREYVVYCKAGTRSLKAARLMTGLGFKSVSSLRGGIMAWQQEVEPSMPRY